MKIDAPLPKGQILSPLPENPAMAPTELQENEVPRSLQADPVQDRPQHRASLNDALFDVIEVRLAGLEQMPTAADGSTLLVALGGGCWALAAQAQVIRLREHQEPTLDYDLDSVVHWQGAYFDVWVEEIEGKRLIGIRKVEGEGIPA